MKRRWRRGAALLVAGATLGIVTGCRAGAMRVLDALWYRTDPAGKVVYGVTRHRAMVDPNFGDEVRVGVFEQYVDATGAEWRTSVWLAAFLASVTLGESLTGHRYSISVGGFIDGPSAGALMAAGFMAAMTGASVRPEVTMTGALAPDGSIAPVGGIPHKIRAAQRAGKKLVGIPQGQAHVLTADGREVDVLRLGRSLGVEVRELATLDDAYRLLTGSRLESRRALPPEAMGIGARLAARLGKRIRAMVNQGRRDLHTGDDRVTDAAAREQRAHIGKLGKEALFELGRGNVAAAFAVVIEAAARARSVKLIASLSRDPKLERAEKQARAAVRELEEDLASLAKDSAGKPLVLLAAASNAARARGYLEMASALLGTLRAAPARKPSPSGAPSSSAVPRLRPGTGLLGRRRRPLAGRRRWLSRSRAQRKPTRSRPGRRVWRAVVKSPEILLPATYLGYATILVDRARDVLASFVAATPNLRLAPAAIRRVSGALASVATGNIEYTDALLVREVARSQNVKMELARNAFALSEHSYLVGVRLAGRAVQRRQLEAMGIGQGLLTLAESAISYLESAVVITRYYSLGGLGTGGKTEDTKESREQRRLLLALLARAEESARKAAALARERIGVVPAEARILYQAATGMSRGDVLRKLRALNYFWRSGIASRLAAEVVVEK